MIRGTVTCFLESDILYKNGLTYEQGKERDGTDYHERDKRSVKEVRVREIKGERICRQ